MKERFKSDRKAVFQNVRCRAAQSVGDGAERTTAPHRGGNRLTMWKQNTAVEINLFCYDDDDHHHHYFYIINYYYNLKTMVSFDLHWRILARVA